MAGSRNRSVLLALVAVSFAVAVGAVRAEPRRAPPTPRAPAGGHARPRPFTPQPGRYYLRDVDIRALRLAVKTRPWAREAWARTKAAADAALKQTPNPAPATGVDYSQDGRDSTGACVEPARGWRCVLYSRGLADGQDVLNLARAYAISGRRAYAEHAKSFLLAWARTYSPPNPRVAHAIAEPAGFMLKGFLAYDLVRPTFTEAERQEFRGWAKLFVPDGEARADAQRDDPGIPDQTYGGDTSNWQSFGNSATFSRALAVTAAAVVGGDELKRALDWNWDHTTPGGRDNGWRTLIDGEIIDGTGGETFEGRARGDIGYGLLGSNPLLLIAHIARYAGFRVDLYTYTTDAGNNVLSPFLFYAPYLDGARPWPPSDKAYGHRDSVTAEYRTALELPLADSHPQGAKLLQQVRDAGGPRRRGANYDLRIGLYNALAGVRGKG